MATEMTKVPLGSFLDGDDGAFPFKDEDNEEGLGAFLFKEDDDEAGLRGAFPFTDDDKEALAFYPYYKKDGDAAAFPIKEPCVVCKVCAAKGEDSWPPHGHDRCKICVAKAAALNRIEAAGGDSVRAAEDSAARAGSDVCVLETVSLDTIMPSSRGKKMIETAAEEGEPARPSTGTIVMKTKMVPEACIKRWLTDPPFTILLPLSEEFLRRNPHRLESILATAAATLSVIEHVENILAQYFKKGFAVMEVEVD